MKIVIDHLRGSRRGQRQEFRDKERVTIGRHPRSDVSFDAHRDLDSSARHAELRRRGEGYALCDVGSSNGTFVAGERVGELPLVAGRSIEVEFGAGGPVLRVWLGGVDEVPEPFGAGRRRTLGTVVLVAVALALALVVFALAR